MTLTWSSGKHRENFGEANRIVRSFSYSTSVHRGPALPGSALGSGMTRTDVGVAPAEAVTAARAHEPARTPAWRMWWVFVGSEQLLAHTQRLRESPGQAGGPTLPAGGVVSTRQGFSLPARVCGLTVFVRALRSWRCRGPGISYGLGGHCWTLCMRRTAGDKQDRRSLFTGEEAGRHLRPLLIPEAAANCCSKCVHREKHERNDLERGRHRSGDSNAVFVACMAEEKEGLEQKESSPERQGARQGDRGPNQTRAGRAPSSWSPDGLASLPARPPPKCSLDRIFQRRVLCQHTSPWWKET